MEENEVRVKKPDGNRYQGWRLPDGWVCIRHYRPEPGDIVYVDGEERVVAEVGEETSLRRTVTDENGKPVTGMAGRVTCYPTAFEELSE